MPDGNVLIWFAFRIEKRNYRRVHPVDATVLCEIAKFALPDLAGRNGSPEITNEILGMVGGIDDAVVLTQQFFPRVFRDTAKLIVHIINDSALVGDRYNRR